MSRFPISKYVAEDYRQSLNISDAPSFVDTELAVLPVIDIQKGFPRPNSRQTIKTMMLSKGGAADTQIVTRTSSTNVYFIGIVAQVLATGGLNVGDATSGSLVNTDGATNQLLAASVSANTYIEFFAPLPVKLLNGLRVSNSGAVGFIGILYYMEELI